LPALPFRRWKCRAEGCAEDMSDVATAAEYMRMWVSSTGRDFTVWEHGQSVKCKKRWWGLEVKPQQQGDGGDSESLGFRMKAPKCAECPARSTPAAKHQHLDPHWHPKILCSASCGAGVELFEHQLQIGVAGCDGCLIANPLLEPYLPCATHLL
jgi:hypothetical protein